MKLRRWATAVVGTLASLAFAGSASAAVLAQSTFDADDEGWRVAGELDRVAPTHVASGGNPGGYVSIADPVTGGTLYWVAPASFTGDKSAAYGGRLTFDLRQSATDNQFDEPDVVLNGAIGGTTVSLVYDTSPNPGTTFTSYSVPLKPAGWVDNSTGLPATAAQFKATLASLADLGMRAEFRSGPDVDDLDNPTLIAPPETTITSGPANNRHVDDATPTFTFESSEPAGATFQCRLAAGRRPSGQFSFCNSGSFTPSPDLADGEYTFQVRARTADGLIDLSPATRRFTVDTVAPETTITGGPEDGSTTDDPAPTFTFASSEPSGARFRCRLVPGATGSGPYAACNSGSFTPGAPLADGQYTFQVLTTDRAGNSDPTPAKRTFTVLVP